MFFSLLVVLVSSSVFKYENTNCLTDFRGDNVCDRSCMNQDGFYDSSKDQLDSSTIFQSDCISQCFAYNCTQELLENSGCDYQCDYWECGWDNGNCGFCEQNCTEEYLSNNLLDEECNTLYCYYDNGMGGWCAPGCFYEDMQSETKKESCNVANCSYQNGLWLVGVAECSIGCTQLMLENSNCDESCNNPACNWDNSKCLCSPGCTTSDLSEKTCSLTSPCMTQECDYFDGACSLCSAGCLNSSLGNGEEDESCNTEACDYDQGDLGCAPNCSSSFKDGVWHFVGGCSEYCLVESCLFNYGVCDDSLALDFAIFHSIFYGDYNKVVSYPYTESCNKSLLLSFNSTNKCPSDSPCNTIDFLFCNGYSTSDKSDAEPSCLRRAKDNCLLYSGDSYFRDKNFNEKMRPGDMMAVKAGESYYSEIGTNVKNLSDLMGVNITWIKEGSYSSKSPLEIVVDDQTTFYSALARAVSPYTVIKINCSECNFEAPKETFYYVDNYIEPLKQVIDVPQYSLEIKGIGNSRPVIQFMSNLTLSGNFKKIVISNVEFSGKYLLSKSCNEEKCYYCPKLITIKDSMKMTDRNMIVLTKDLDKYGQYCGGNKTYIPFSFTTPTYIQNTLFSHFQTQTTHLIKSSSTLSITDSEFIKTQPLNEQALIYQDCAAASSCASTSLQITNTSVQDFNYGYEHIDDMTQGYFLEVRDIGDVSLLNMNFEFCMSISCETCTFNSFLYFTNIQGEIIIQDCVFENLYIRNLIEIDSENLNYEEVSYDLYGKRKEYEQTHLIITGCEFSSIYAQNGLILYTMGSIKQNVYIADCEFEKIVVMASGVFNLVSLTYFSDAEAAGEWFYYVEGGNRSYVNEPMRTCVIERLSLVDVAAGVKILSTSNYPNVLISDLNIMNVKEATEQDPFDYVIKNFMNAGKYLTKSPLSSLIPVQELSHILEIDYFYYSYIDNVNISEVNLGVSGIIEFSVIYAYNAGSNFTINDFSLSGVELDSLLGIAIDSYSVSSFIASGISIDQVNNGYFGLISIEKTDKVIMNDILFSNSSTNYSSAIEIIDANFVNIDKVQASSLESYDSKGTILYLRLGSDPDSVILNDVSISDSSNMHGTGLVLYLDSLTSLSTFKMNLASIYINKCNSSDSIIYLASNLQFEDATIEYISMSYSIVKNGGLITDVHNSGVLSIRYLQSMYNEAFYCSIYGKYRNSGLLLNLYDSIIKSCTCTSEALVFEGNSQSTITSRNLTFSSTTSSVYTISLNKVMFFSDSLTLENISEGIGLFLTMSNCNLTNLSIKNLSTKVIFSLNSWFICESCLFTSISNMIFSSYQQSKFFISNSNFTNSESDSNNLIYITSLELKYLSLFTGCLFKDNKSSKELILIENSNMKILGSTIEDNDLDGVTVIKATSSILIISESCFRNQSYRYIDASLGSEVQLDSCQFSGADLVIEGLDGGLEENRAALEGFGVDYDGMIYVKESKLEVGASEFFDVFSSSGAVIYSDSTDVVIKDSKFYNCSTTLSDSGVVYLNKGSITISSSSFSSSKTSTALLYLQNPTSIQISSSSFSQNTNTNGGAIYAKSDNSATFSLSNSTFTSNTASGQGGALKCENFNLTITSCSFSYNEAKSNGGALFLSKFNCEDCKVSFVGSSFFSHNLCENCSGGAIHWSGTEPINLSLNSFVNNSARYGNDNATKPSDLKVYDSRRLYDVENFKPGGSYAGSILICMYDVYGQITDDSSYDSLTGSLNGVGNLTVSSDVIKCSNGCFNLTEFIVKGSPGSKGSFLFVLSDFPSNDVSGAGGKAEANFSISIQLRECIYGEKISENECSICDPPKYLINSAEVCLNCPTGAQCLGGYLMLPDSGYWKLNMYSSTVMSCPISSACLGSTSIQSSDLDYTDFEDSDIDFTGSCATGHYGHLCATCETGYSKSTSGLCSKCPNTQINALIMTSIMIAMIFVAYIMVSSTLKSAFSAKSLHSIYIKIFTNYLQIVFLTTQFNLNWPTYVLSFFEIQKNAASASDQLYSIDCFFTEKSGYSNEDIYYYKLLTAALIPIIIWSLSFIVWIVVCFFKETYKFIKREFFTSIIVLFFLVHPNIVKTIFSSFSCREIVGIDYWLVDNLEIQCFTQSHYKLLLTISLPCIVLWGFGVPAVVLVIMVKRYKELGKDYNKVVFGFLYNGFKQRKFFWEFVILYRKIFIICITVFMSQVSTIIQALTVVILLLFALYLQYSQHPYSCKQLNYMEIEALFTATLTIYCGLYYLSDSINSIIQAALFVAIVLGNSYFLLYWIYYMSKAFIDIVVNIYPWLRILFKRGDFLDDKIYEQNLQNEGIFFDKSEGEKKYTLFKQRSQSLKVRMAGIKSMDDIFKAYMKKKVKVNVKKKDPTDHDSLMDDF